MAFDGITIAAVVKQLNDTILGGRLYKIAQPEKDELLLTVKKDAGQYRLMMSADASLPLIYLTQENKKSPMTAPSFCMLLRKYVQNGRIVKIHQPGLERVIQFEIEHLDEMGDCRRKILVMELMGKHSNIIFCDDSGMILDSIKHVSAMVSSVREVLPGRAYFIPETTQKLDPLSGIGPEEFARQVCGRAALLYKAVYAGFTGISPIVAQELCHRAQLDGDLPAQTLDDASLCRLHEVFDAYMRQVEQGVFAPFIVYEHGQPVEFAVLPLTIYDADMCKPCDTISALLGEYYAQKNAQTRIRQKSADLRRIVATALERNAKKYDLQLRQLEDTQKREKYKIYGELLHTYGYQVQEGARQITVENYYTGEELTIPLDKDLSAMENAKKYFDRYGKLKRTYEAVTELVQETKEQIEHLASVENALDIAQTEGDLAQIREELVQSGYIRYKGGKKKEKTTTKPLHFVSSDGFDMYVGKNNFQNEEITFRLAQGNDWWFHAKGMPGSHVIVKSGGAELPDSTFEEAGKLAAHFSAAKGRDKVEVDYVQKKHVKKPGGAKPGFVVYYTNYSLLIDADISAIQKVE